MRVWVGSIVAFAVLLATVTGGCPQPLSDGVTGTDDVGLRIPGSTGNADGGAGSTDGSSGSAGDVAGTSDQEFADCNAPLQASSWEAEILRLVNLERSRQGLTTLVRNDVLGDQAAAYACELVQYDFFAHINPVTGSTLKDRAEEFGYQYRVIGENLAAGQSSPQQAFNDWMDSPGHRANILNPEFTELGVAVRLGGDYGVVWVQEFGRRLFE